MTDKELQKIDDFMEKAMVDTILHLKSNPKQITVIKRNGSKVPFEKEKVKDAIKPAFRRCHVRYTNNIYDDILDNIYKKLAGKCVQFVIKERQIPQVYMTIGVEDIQNIVEETLMGSYPQVAKEYILYRNHREEIRKFVDKKEAWIDQYKASSNTANSTVDDNSNVTNKNIGILNNEIHKEDNIYVSRRMVVRKLRKIFPDFSAKQYERDLVNHIIYKHDESSFAGAVAPYTYSAKEVIHVKYNEVDYLIPFDLLYDLIEEPETNVNPTDIVFQKYPDNLYVSDKNHTWVKVTTITKKKRHRDLYRIKTSFGEDIVVTDNHPLITDLNNIEETTPAIDSLGKSQYKEHQKIEFKGRQILDLATIFDTCEVYESFIRYDKHELKRFINLTEEFGYVIGFFIGDGNFNNNTGYLNFTQKDVSLLNKINSLLFDATGKAGTVRYHCDRNIHTLEVRSRGLFNLFKNFFGIQDKAQGKTLPINILEFNEDFAKGIVEGLYDADGTINYHQIWLKLASRSAILQVAEIMRYFGYSVGNGIQSIPFSNTGYKTNYSLWTLGCSRRMDSTPMNLSFKWKNSVISESTPKYKFDGEVKITNVQKIEENDSFLYQNEFIYDITTETHTFILNNIIVHNCVALTMYPFLDGGIKGIGGLSAKPKNIDSYCGMLVNMIFAVSAQFAGAVAVPEALLYFDYFARKEWGEDYYKEFDSFYKLGPKMRRLLNESHYWCNNINELRVHDFGSEELNKLRDELVYNGERPLTETELEMWKNHSINNPDFQLKLGDGTRTIGGQIHQYFQQIIYSINQPAAARGLQSAFVNFSYYDKAFYEGMFGNFVFPDFTSPKWESLNWLQKDFMQWFNAERLKCVLTFPVESFAMVYQNGEFLDPENARFVAQEYARGHSFFTYISDTVDSLSSCCRLKNKLQTKEFNFTNGNMGLQTGSKSVITLNLNRIIQDCDRAYGLNRNGGWRENTSFLDQYLKEILDRVYKYHTAYNELLWDVKDKGLLPVYDAGFIDLNKQYLTIGINGLNQAAEYLGIRCNDNDDYKAFCQHIFGFISQCNKEAGKEKFNGHTLTFNTEQVPAESLAIKNYNWDKEDEYWVPEDTNLYASYIFKPNDPTLDIFEKLRMHGSEYIGDYLDGGAAAHLNLEEHLNEDQYMAVIDYAAQVGCNYFTFNIPMTECKKCGHIVNAPVHTCPKCGSEDIKYWVRIIGYLTAVPSWSSGRQEEFKTRIFHGKKAGEYATFEQK